MMLSLAESTDSFGRIPEKAGVGGSTPSLATTFSMREVEEIVKPASKAKTPLTDRMSDDVLMLTGQRPLSVQEVVGSNAATFTASAKAA